MTLDRPGDQKSGDRLDTAATLPDLPTAERLKNVAIAGGGATALLGGLGLLGWLSGLRVLAGIDSRYVPMAVSTGFSFLLLGSILVLHARRPSRGRVRASAALVAALTALYGWLRFVEYFAALRLTAEELLFPPPETLASIPLNRMSPVTGALFGLAGISIVLILWARPHWPFQHLAAGLGGLVCVVGFVASVGYLFGTPLLYGGGVIPLAVTTAIAFLLLGAGLAAAAGPGSFLAQPLRGDSVRARVLRVFLPLTAILVLAQGFLHETVSRYTEINPALVAALSTLAFVMIAGVVVVQATQVIARALERAEAERGRAEAALQQNERRFRALVENSADAISLFGPDGTVLYDSPAAPGLLGYEAGELVGRNVFEYIHADDLPSVIGLFGRLLQEPRGKVEGIFRFRHKDESWRWLEGVATNLLEEPGVQAVVANYRDITERKRSETLVRRRAEELLAVNMLGTALAETLDREQIFERFYQAIMQLLPDSVTVFISSFDSDRQLIICDFAVQDGIRLNEKELPPILLEPPGVGTQSEAIHTRRPIIINDLNERLKRVRVRVQVGTPGAVTQSGLYVPMLARGEVAGVVQVQSLALNRYTTADAELLGLAANTAAAAVENARLFEQVRARGEELEILFSLSTCLREAQTADDILPIALREARRLLQADAGAVVLREPDGEHLTLALADGYLAPNPRRSFAAAASLSATVLRTRQPFVTSDYAAEPRRLADVIGAEAIGPAVLVPLQSEVELLGTLMVARRRGEASPLFSPVQVRLLTAIGEMVGNALRRARLFDDAERRLRRTQALRSIDMAITASTDLRFTLATVLEEVTAELKLDAAAVLLFNSHTQMLEYAAGRGFRTKAIERSQVRLGQGHAGRAALERRTVHVPDLSQAGDQFVRAPQLTGEGFVAYFGVPLIAKGQVKGVLDIFHRAPLKPDREWLEFMESLAGQAAIAIDNATLFDGLQRSNVELALAYDATIEGWSRALDLRDKETEGHTLRVTQMTLRLARAMGWRDAELIHMRWGALLHDIGKMGVPDSILLNPGPLTDDEWAIMRRHPQYAYEMLAPIAYLRPALDIPYCHHEKWDGTGYPRGLKGETIPLAARIFAVADVWDALRSDRPYRAAWPEAKVREHIRSLAGTHFDPKAAETFLAMNNEQRSGE